MFDNLSKIYVSVEDLAVRIIHVDPDRLLFMFDERILILLKSDSFYLPSVKTPKMATNPLKKTEIRRYTTEVPAFRPFFQRYGWTLWKCHIPFFWVTMTLLILTSNLVSRIIVTGAYFLHFFEVGITRLQIWCVEASWVKRR